jgi:2-methylcitrate dehydratase PrpD
MTVEVTTALAELAARPLDPAPPGEALHAAERTVANALPLAVGAAEHPASRIALATVAGLSNEPDSSVLGRDERLSAQWAAFVNGIGIHVEDFDDTHLPTVIHPGAPVVPAALALAERTGSSGREMVEAVLVGVEVALRVGLGVSPSHFDRGWHITSTTGHFGAAAAAGRILGLDMAAMANALGIVATQAAGVQAALGTMTKSFHPGKAAANGVEAAMLAAAGFTGPMHGIEGRRGFASVTAADADLEAMETDIGEHWHAVDNAFKPYACGIVSHAAIDAAIVLRDAIPDSAAIDEIEVEVNPIVLDVMGVEDPTDGLQSKFSVYHCVAVGLMDGAAGPPQYSDARALDPATRELRAKVQVRLNAQIARDEARIVARTASGELQRRHIEHATGSERSPMSDRELWEKARLVAGPRLGDRVDELVSAALELRQLDRAARLAELARPVHESLGHPEGAAH